MNAHYHDFSCEWRCYFGQQVAPKDTIIFIAQRVRDVTENLQNVYDTQKKQRVIKLQLLIFCTLDLFGVTRVVVAVAVAVAENDTDHVTCKMEPLLQLVKMD